MIQFPQSLHFSNLPTPIIPLKSIWSTGCRISLWMKRDDLTGLEVSGNKVRKLDFLLYAASRQQATHLLTCGSSQSNHCRTSAYLAAKLGMKPVLFLKGGGNNSPTGNLLLNTLVRPEIIPVTAEEYTHVDGLMAERALQIHKQGGKGYCIPEGGSNSLGIWGYIRCFREIMMQIREQALPIDTVVVATGSGGTHAGLLLGKLIYSSPLQVISINVCDDADFCRKKIMNIIADFNHFYGYEYSCNQEEITIIDGFVGSGYGRLNADEARLIREFAGQEGIVLDPVYTVKAFLGLQMLMQDGRLTGKNILFIHTGGIFSIFSYTAELIRD
jgi:D-cysteine desulfhydrase